MDRISAHNLIKETFESGFNKEQYRKFIINLFDDINTNKSFSVGNAQIKAPFQKSILSYQRIGQYIDKNGKIIDALLAHLSDDVSLERTRTLQRNFVADYLVTRDHEQCVIAFYKDNEPNWRFSFVKLDLFLQENDNGNLNVKKEFTSARRFSFLVGNHEPSHIAQSRFLRLLEKDYQIGRASCRE